MFTYTTFTKQSHSLIHQRAPLTIGGRMYGPFAPIYAADDIGVDIDPLGRLIIGIPWPCEPEGVWLCASLFNTRSSRSAMVVPPRPGSAAPLEMVKVEPKP